MAILWNDLTIDWNDLTMERFVPWLSLYAITFSQKFHTMKIENFDYHNWSDCFLLKPIFLCQARQVLISLGS